MSTSDISSASDAHAGSRRSSGRGMAIASLVLSLVSLGVSGVIGISAVFVEGFGANAQLQTQISSTCMSWATYVTEEQSDPKWESQPTAEVDRRIDRVGTVLFSRIAASGDATSGTAAAPSSPTPIREVSIAEICGSAAEFRRASSSDEPLELR